MFKKETKSVIIIYDNNSIERNYIKDEAYLEKFDGRIRILVKDKVCLEFSEDIPHIIEYY